MLMSFYGSVGTIMDGSGISKLFECVYGPNAVKHVVTGKAVSRASRAHLPTESATMVKLQKTALTKNCNENMSKELIDSLKTFYKFDLQIPELSSLKDFIDQTKISLISKSRTARFWF